MVTLAPIPPGALAKYDPQIDFPTVAEAGWNGDDLLGIGGLSWTEITTRAILSTRTR